MVETRTMRNISVINCRSTRKYFWIVKSSCTAVFPSVEIYSKPMNRASVILNLNANEITNNKYDLGALSRQMDKIFPSVVSTLIGQ